MMADNVTVTLDVGEVAIAHDAVLDACGGKFDRSEMAYQLVRRLKAKVRKEIPDFSSLNGDYRIADCGRSPDGGAFMTVSVRVDEPPGAPFTPFRIFKMA